MRGGRGGRGGSRSNTGPTSVVPHDIASLKLEEWLTLQDRLLADERAEEVSAAVALLSTGRTSDLEARGVVLPRLIVASVTTGLFGRCVVRLADRFERSLPSHRFTPGDIVGLRVAGKGSSSGGVGVGGAMALTVGGDARSSYDASGVVTMTDDGSVSVALDEEGGKKKGRGESDLADGGNGVEFGDKIRLDRLADDVTYKRLREVVAAVRRARSGPAQRLLNLLFQGAPPTNVVQTTDGGTWATPHFLDTIPPIPILRSQNNLPVVPSSTLPPPNPLGWTPFHTDLNDSQRDAISAALRASDLCLIHGPPGTGKTTTVVEYIRQEVVRGRRVLATAPSNVAVDNLLARLVQSSGSSSLRVIRLGHPARVSPALLTYTLDAALASSPGASLVADAKRDLAAAGAEYKKTKDKARKRELRADENALRKEIRVREQRLLVDAIRRADVVLTTVTGAATKALLRAAEAGVGATPGAPPPLLFDVCVIDEAAQALEAAALIPLLLAPRLIAAGDHLQLSPTVTSKTAAAAGLGFTLAERIVRLWGDGTGTTTATTSSTTTGGTKPLCPYIPRTPPVHMLTEQYRMHATISDWASNALYGGRLKPSPRVATHLLSHLPHTHFPPLQNAEGDAGIVCVPASALREARNAAVTGARESLADADSSGSARQLLDAATAAALLAAHVRDAGSDVDDIEIDTDALNAPLLLIDTAGCSLWEEEESVETHGGGGGGGGSRSNAGEADVVVKHVWALINGCGLKPSDVGVLTPYNAQATLLRALLGAALPAGVIVSTVDGFQGQEVEALVISCVRSNSDAVVGFLSDARRMNVAVTRARRHCAIICDSDTLGSDAFLQGLIDHASTHGEVRMASIYRDGPGRGNGGGAPPPPPPSSSRRQTAKKGALVTSAADSRLLPRYGPDAPLSVTATAWLAVARSQLKAFTRACDCIDVERPSGVSAIRAIAIPGRDVAPFSEVIVDIDTMTRIPRLSFPPGALSPLQRALFHRASDALGLPHVSTGEGLLRILSVEYVPPIERERRRVAFIAGGGGHNTTTAPSLAVTSSDDTGNEITTAPDIHWTRLLAGLDLGGGEEEEEDEEIEKGTFVGMPTELSTAPPTLSSPSSVQSLEFAPPSNIIISTITTVLPPAQSLTPPSNNIIPPSTTVVSPAQSTKGKKLGTAPPLTSSATSSSSLLMASLHAERSSRLASIIPPPSPLSVDEMEAAAALLNVSSKKSVKKQAKNKRCEEAEEAEKFIPPRDADGAKREFGVRVEPLKALDKSLAKGGGKKGNGKTVAAAADDDDDDMALLDAIVAAAGSCPVIHCSKSTKTTGATCAHCRLRFCYDHGMPEVHGCGNDARSGARKAWLEGGGAAAHSGGQAKPKNRDVLKRELDKKIDSTAAEAKGSGMKR